MHALRRILLLASLLGILQAVPLFATDTFDADLPMPREKVEAALPGGAYGGFVWSDGGAETPFLPRGFPQWGMSRAEVETLLGSPGETGEALGMTVLGYPTADLLLEGDRLVGFRFDREGHDPDLNPLLKTQGWSRSPRSNDRFGPDSPLYGHRFATYRDPAPRIAVTAWLASEGPDAGAYVTLRSTAERLGLRP